jgi:hypothetical protein
MARGYPTRCTSAGVAGLPDVNRGALKLSRLNPQVQEPIRR